MSSKHQEDLAHIRSMMEKSSRFISLSGLSGVFAGIFALLGAGVAFMLLRTHNIDYANGAYISFSPEIIWQFVGLALVILFLSVGVGIYFTLRKSKKKGVNLWNPLTRNVITHLAIPLATGGIFCLALLYHQLTILIAPSMLIFYGLALVNVSKFTFGDVKWLGYFEILLGLVACFFVGNGLIFWALGFGILHIIYGLIMFNKYDKD